MELPSYGWAFTPGHIDRGAVYQFVLNHIVSVDDPLEVVRITMIDTGRQGCGAVLGNDRSDVRWPTELRPLHRKSATQRRGDRGGLRSGPETVLWYPIPDLLVLKISYPRLVPQGGIEERDLHPGQQYARLLDIELATSCSSMQWKVPRAHS